MSTRLFMATTGIAILLLVGVELRWSAVEAVPILFRTLPSHLHPALPLITLSPLTEPAVLHAYDATNLANQLYSREDADHGRDNFGNGNKFITPTVVNSKVYVGTTNGVGVFGLFK